MDQDKFNEIIKSNSDLFIEFLSKNLIDYRSGFEGVSIILDINDECVEFSLHCDEIIVYKDIKVYKEYGKDWFFEHSKKRLEYLNKEKEVEGK